jgi:hypothetical protein
MEDIGGEKRGFLANEGNVPLYVLLDEPPPVDGPRRTPLIAPNRVLAMVIVRRFGFSGLRMGRMNSITLRSLSFRQFAGWNPSFELCSPRNLPT